MSQQVEIINLVISGAGLALCLLMAFSVLFQRNIDLQTRRYSIGLFFSMAGMNFAYGLSRSHLFLSSLKNQYSVRLGIFLEYGCAALLILTITRYLIECVAQAEKRRSMHRKALLFFCLQIVLLIVAQFTDLYYTIDSDLRYQRSSTFWIPIILLLLMILQDVFLLIRHRRKLNRRQAISFWICLILPVVGLLVQLFVYGILFIMLATTLALVVFFYGIIQEEVEKDNRRKQENTEMRIAIMMSQIRPHFLYNTLDSIYYLCGKDPEKAQQTVSEFSDYLRGNLDFLTINKLIPFQKEKEHVETYLRLENTTAGDTLQTVFDYEAEDFLLPAMTIQTLVENAVHHGLEDRPDGGTITIRTRKEAEEIVITVEDDGAGFDPASLEELGPEHVGIANVRERLALLCDGSLEIQSAPGGGTRATIRLPAQKPEEHKDTAAAGSGL